MSDHVRAEGTNGRYQPDKFAVLVEQFKHPSLWNPIETSIAQDNVHCSSSRLISRDGAEESGEEGTV
jgi:hypothetical protein